MHPTTLTSSIQEDQCVKEKKQGTGKKHRKIIQKIGSAVTNTLNTISILSPSFPYLAGRQDSKHLQDDVAAQQHTPKKNMDSCYNSHCCPVHIYAKHKNTLFLALHWPDMLLQDQQVQAGFIQIPQGNQRWEAQSRDACQGNCNDNMDLSWMDTLTTHVQL